MSALTEMPAQTLVMIISIYLLIHFVIVEMVLGFNKIVSKLFKKKIPSIKSNKKTAIGNVTKKEESSKERSLFVHPKPNHRFPLEGGYLDLTKLQRRNA